MTPYMGRAATKPDKVSIWRHWGIRTKDFVFAYYF